MAAGVPLGLEALESCEYAGSTVGSGLKAALRLYGLANAARTISARSLTAWSCLKRVWDLSLACSSWACEGVDSAAAVAAAGGGTNPPRAERERSEIKLERDVRSVAESAG